MIKIDVVYPNELHERVKREAQRRGVTMNDVINDLIRRHLPLRDNVRLESSATRAEISAILCELIEKHLPPRDDA